MISSYVYVVRTEQYLRVVCIIIFLFRISCIHMCVCARVYVLVLLIDGDAFIVELNAYQKICQRNLIKSMNNKKRPNTSAYSCLFATHKNDGD